MIDYSEIEKTLLESEANYDTSFAALTKIAPLYCAMLYKMFSSKTAVSQPEPLDVSGDSDFLSAVSGKNSVEIFAVMDELMDTIKIINGKLYTAVMKKLDAIVLVCCVLKSNSDASCSNVRPSSNLRFKISRSRSLKI